MMSSRWQPLPPDVDEARKARINSDLIEIFKRPCPPNTTASIQGIGLYTHVAAPSAPPPVFPHMRYTQKASNPQFLPIGGPKEMTGDRRVQSPISDDVKKAFKDVTEAVNEEKRHVAFADMDLDQLKERYGAVDVPDQGVRAGAARRQSESRPSVDNGDARDVVMGVTEEQGRTGSISSRNEYEAARDPRLRRR